MEQINKVKLFNDIVAELSDLYEKKNKNYGDSFGETWSKLGPISGLTRLHDKLNRATSLITGEKNEFESLEDTFIDLANYAIMSLIEVRLHK